jgi:hypothetical protein
MAGTGKPAAPAPHTGANQSRDGHRPGQAPGTGAARRPLLMRGRLGRRDPGGPDQTPGSSADLWAALGETAAGEAAFHRARAGRLVARLDRLPRRAVGFAAAAIAGLGLWRNGTAGSGRWPGRRAR